MKDKKNILIVVLTVITSLLLVYAISNVIKNSDSEVIKEKKVMNLKKGDFDYPEFTIVLSGLYEGAINAELLKDEKLSKYEFELGINNTWETVINKYEGSSLMEVFKKLDIKDFSELVVTAPGGIEISYDYDQLENAYLVYYRDDKQIRDNEEVLLLLPDYEYRYSVENVIYFEFK